MDEKSRKSEKDKAAKDEIEAAMIMMVGMIAK